VEEDVAVADDAVAPTATEPTGNQAENEVVIPVTLPRGATREIVLRIVIQNEE
jgi:hypothetical protein